MHRDRKFWTSLDTLVASSEIVIDRPKRSQHPDYPDLIYPVDYGYLNDTRSQDGHGIDIWVGSRPEKTIDSILCVVDSLKRDSEIKILYGCTALEKRSILRFHNSQFMKAAMLTR